MFKKFLKFLLFLVLIIAALFFYDDYDKKKEREPNLGFFTTEDYVSEEARNIKWTPIEGANNKEGQFQKGFNSKGQLLFREVRRNDSPPMFALYYLSLSSENEDSFIVQPVWIVDCKEDSIIEYMMDGVKGFELRCRKGKYLTTQVPYARITSGYLDAQGFEYYVNPYKFDMNELKQNRTLLNLNK